MYFDYAVDADSDVLCHSSRRIPSLFSKLFIQKYVRPSETILFWKFVETDISYFSIAWCHIKLLNRPMLVCLFVYISRNLRTNEVRELKFCFYPKKPLFFRGFLELSGHNKARPIVVLKHITDRAIRPMHYDLHMFQKNIAIDNNIAACGQP